MNFKWGRKQLTVLLLPDANKRAMQWRFPVMFMYVIPSFIALVVLATVISVYLIIHWSAMGKEAVIQHFTIQMNQLQSEMMDKDDRINELQIQIIDFSDQVGQFEQMLQQIKELEHELGKLTGVGANNLHLSAIADPATNRSNPVSILSLGGEIQPISDGQMEELVEQTRHHYTQLVAEMNTSLLHLLSSEQILREQERLRDMTPSIWPTVSRTIRSGYGVRKDPFTKRPSMHTGLDIAGKLNDPVYAAAQGRVTFSGSDSTHGNYVKIDHTHGIVTLYMHLNKILVKKGDTVSKGDQIGLLGNTGRSTGPHLHYQIEKNNKVIDPGPYLKGR